MVEHQARKHLIDFSIATNPKYKVNWHHNEIAKELEHIEKYGDRDYKILILLVPPRNGKSQLASINFPAWYLGRNPTKEIITSSYSAELAQDFGSKTKELFDDIIFQRIFNLKLKADEKSKAKWMTEKKGSYISVGIGGAITGRGSNILIIDDPIKNREEAGSEIIRNKHWNWFTSCFVKGTPILMSNGTYKNIEDIKINDEIISFKEGKLDKKKVKAVGKQNKDKIYNIKGRYGEVKCTGEHPFYVLPVKRTGRYLGIKKGKWIKAKNLRKDDRILISLKGVKNGSARRKRLLKSRKFVLKELWWLSGFILGDGFLSKYKLGIALGKNEKLNKYVISLCEKYLGKTKIINKGRSYTCWVYKKKAVDLLLHIGLSFKHAKDKNIDDGVFKQPLSSREAFISGFLSADGHRISKTRWTVGLASERLLKDLRLLAINSGYLCGLVGKSEFIAQPPGSPKPINAIAYRLHLRKKRVGFYANRIKEIKECEEDYSYNLEVDDYGTFIANGFIVHNTAYTRLEPKGVIILIQTRWHLDDLAGRILKHPELSKKCKVIEFPAIAEKDEEFRKKGEALWADKYSLENLNQIKETIGIYDWSSLFQQKPVLTENQEFKQMWFQKILREEVDKMNTRNFLTIDTAMSEKASADFTGFCENYVNRENKWHFAAYKMKLNAKDLVDYIFTIHAKRNFEKIGIEKTAYLWGLKPYLDEEMRKRNIFLPIVELQHKQTQKETRIRGLIPRYSSYSIYHIEGECQDLEEELITFPRSINDDTSDSASYQCQIAEQKNDEKQEDFNLYKQDFS